MEGKKSLDPRVVVEIADDIAFLKEEFEILNENMNDIKNHLYKLTVNTDNEKVLNSIANSLSKIAENLEK